MAGKMNPQLQRLIAERDRLRAAVSSLQGELTGIERALSLLSADDQHAVPIESQLLGRRLPVKDTVLRLLQERGAAGMASGELLDLAKRQGQPLDQGTVSSLLSRLKREGVLIYIDKKYRVAPPSPPPNGASAAPPSVIQPAPAHPAVGASTSWNLPPARTSLKAVGSH